MTAPEIDHGQETCIRAVLIKPMAARKGGATISADRPAHAGPAAWSALLNSDPLPGRAVRLSRRDVHGSRGDFDNEGRRRPSTA